MTCTSRICLVPAIYAIGVYLCQISWEDTYRKIHGSIWEFSHLWGKRDIGIVFRGNKQVYTECSANMSAIFFPPVLGIEPWGYCTTGLHPQPFVNFETGSHWVSLADLCLSLPHNWDYRHVSLSLAYVLLWNECFLIFQIWAPVESILLQHIGLRRLLVAGGDWYKELPWVRDVWVTVSTNLKDLCCLQSLE